MSWATHYIDALNRNKPVEFKPRGNSMRPRIKSGELVTVCPINRELKVGDVVLCKVKGTHYLHLVSAIKGTKYRISNNKGHINGWISLNSIFGICTSH